MIYFSAVGVDEANDALEGTRQATLASKAGKGVRLCDVATGRRVVGHLLLFDIASEPSDDGTKAESTKNEVASAGHLWVQSYA